MALPLIGRNPENDIVKSDTLGSTTVAGVGAFVAGGTGAVITFLEAIDASSVGVELQVAGIALMGLAVLAWSIATAGDAVARAYAAAHVIPGESKPALAQAIEDVSFGVKSDLTGGGKQPALAEAIKALALSYENASFGVKSDLKDGDKQPALAEAIKALALSYENASFGVKSDLKDGDKHPALAEAVKTLGKSVEAAYSPDADRRDYLFQVPAGFRTALDGGESQVLAVRYTPAKSELNLLVVGEDGVVRFTEPTPIDTRSE
jgi:hypothetical protein